MHTASRMKAKALDPRIATNPPTLPRMTADAGTSRRAASRSIAAPRIAMQDRITVAITPKPTPAARERQEKRSVVQFRDDPQISTPPCDIFGQRRPGAEMPVENRESGRTNNYNSANEMLSEVEPSIEGLKIRISTSIVPSF